MEENNAFIDKIIKISFILGVLGIILFSSFDTIIYGFLLLSCAFLLFIIIIAYYFLKEKRNTHKAEEEITEGGITTQDSNSENGKMEFIVLIIRLAPLFVWFYFLASEIYFLINTDLSTISIAETIPFLLFALRVSMIFVSPFIYAKDLMYLFFGEDVGDIKDSNIFQVDLFHRTMNIMITTLVIIRAVEIIF